ncbi:MAG: ABC transporter permease [Candidatus Binatia bacterium]
MWHYVIFLAVFFLVLTPVLFLVLGSFSTASLPTDFSLATMGVLNYVEVYGDPGTYALLTNTVVYVAGSVVLAISLATLLAWLVERTNVPLKAVIYAGVPMEMAMPGMLQAMAWVLLFSPRIGFINVLLMKIFGLSEAPVNIYSLAGMIFIEGTSLVSTAFLMLVPLFRGMDPALEEAAAVSGASPRSVARKVTLRLLAPALVAVTIYQAISALERFEIPGILGLPGGIYVFSTKIYSLVHSATFPPPYGQANALSMVYVAIALIGMYFYYRVIRRSERFAVVTGKGYRPRLIELGRWRYPALALVFLYLAVAIGLPFVTLLYASFLPYLQTPSWEAFQAMTVKNYQMLSRSAGAAIALKNTVIVVFVSATATVLFSFAISMVVVRSKFWGRRLLDQLAFVPHPLPGMVMALAWVWVFLKLDFLPIYGTIWSICIAFIVSFMAYGTRTLNAAILQIHRELEEAAYTSGARPWRTMVRIFFPLMMPAFAGVWIWVALLAARVAGTPLMLAEGQNNMVLSISIWQMWDSGSIGAVAAIGTLLILALMVLTVVIRIVAFRRPASPGGGV